MNPKFFGDSYDLVKRFFCTELSSLGYSISVDPMPTGNWNEIESAFCRLLGIKHHADSFDTSRVALFLDPDTGIRSKGSSRHVSFDRIAKETSQFALVFAFDQSFSRHANASTVMHEKLAELNERQCHAMYYDSHARFLFAAAEQPAIDELRTHLVRLGLPESRLVERRT